MSTTLRAAVTAPVRRRRSVAIRWSASISMPSEASGPRYAAIRNSSFRLILREAAVAPASAQWRRYRYRSSVNGASSRRGAVKGMELIV